MPGRKLDTAAKTTCRRFSGKFERDISVNGDDIELMQDCRREQKDLSRCKLASSALRKKCQRGSRWLYHKMASAPW